MKTKGSGIPGTFCDTYSMDIVDSVFISRTSRRKGFVTNLIQKLANDGHQKNIGFSSPLSIGMKKLLFKYLQRNCHYRDNFRVIKFGFLAFFEAKMTKIDILTLKLIVLTVFGRI